MTTGDAAQATAVGRGGTPLNVGELTILEAASATTLTVPHGSLLLIADFFHYGGDLLLVGRDGTQVLIQDYFARDEPPALPTEGGAGNNTLTLTEEDILAVMGPGAELQFLGTRANRRRGP